MKKKYLKNVNDIRCAHRDIANYFLEAFIESKPLIDLNRNVQIRYDITKKMTIVQYESIFAY
mgnify:CR=1 FL=1